jgi:inner membrane protein
MITPFFTDPTNWAWIWLLGALALLGIELLTTTTLFLWPGIGGVFTGLCLFAAPTLPLSWQVALFGVVSVAAAIAGRQLVKYRARHALAPTALNTPETELIGRTATARPADSAGRATITIDGTVWVARLAGGAPPPEGKMVRVVAVDGAVLIVAQAQD